MKIYKNLFSKMVSMESLLDAWDEFKKGKRNKADVQEFEIRLEDNLFKLHRALVNKKYKHGEYTGFYIRDPKVRHIHKAEVRDRIVHHIIFQYINPIFEPTFIPDSYSARISKGTHKGVKRLGVFARKIYQTHGRCFVLKCDIKKFFPTLDHEILLRFFDSYLGVLSHADSHKLEQELRQKLWEWIKEPLVKTKRDSRIKEKGRSCDLPFVPPKRDLWKKFASEPKNQIPMKPKDLSTTAGRRPPVTIRAIEEVPEEIRTIVVTQIDIRHLARPVIAGARGVHIVP